MYSRYATQKRSAERNTRHLLHRVYQSKLEHLKIHRRCTVPSRLTHGGDKCQSSQRIRFPFGVSNFEEIRLDPSYFYVDNTSIIHQLDAYPQHIIINRPPRWGKSLLLSMLECYYCKSSTDERFERLFGGLHIGICPSASRQSYFVLKLDLSFGAEFSSVGEIHDMLRQSISKSIQFFNARYEFDDEPSPSCSRDTMSGLHQVARRVSEKRGKLLILIDDYDRLANKLLFEDPAAYSNIRHGGIEYSVLSPVRGIFEAIKTLSSVTHCRSIVTGITPIALTNSCGANIWMNVSLYRDFGNVFGFSARDIRQALSLCGLTDKELEIPIALMAKYCNGHQFPGSTCSFFNPTLCLYFLDNYFEHRNWIRGGLVPEEEKVNQEVQAYHWNHEMELMYDQNFNAGDKVLSLLCRSKAASIVVSHLLNKDNPLIVPYIHKAIRFCDIKENSTVSFPQQNLIASFMFYHGIASIRFDDAPHGPPFKLCVPNELIRLLFLKRLKSNLELHQPEVLAFVSKPDAESVRRILQKMVDRQETIKDNSYGEGALQSEIESALNTMQEYVNGLQVTAERDIGKGRFHLCISAESLPPILLELKRIRPNAVNYGPLLAGSNLVLPRDMKWHTSHLDSARKLLSSASPEELRRLEIVLPDEYNGFVSVAQVETGAKLQCSEYLRHMPPETVCFTVIQVGWTLLVKAVSK